MIEALDSLPPFHHDLDELDRPVWGRGSVVLVGDAAHAITPNLGFGAALAIEDAAALGLLIADGCAAPDAASALRRVRHRRARSVQMRSRRIGQAAQLRGAAGWLRNGISRATPSALVARQHADLASTGRGLAERLRSSM